MPEKEPIGFLKSASVEELFGGELERLCRALSMAEAGGLFFVEVSHTSVLKWIAYLTALDSLRDGKKVQEILLHPGLDLPKFEGTGIYFVYTLMESPQQPRPLEDLKETEVRELLKSLNVRRESMARSGWTWVFWCYPETLSALQKEAVDLWVARSGLYSFCLAPPQAIEPPPYDEELSPVEAAEEDHLREPSFALGSRSQKSPGRAVSKVGDGRERGRTCREGAGDPGTAQGL